MILLRKPPTLSSATPSTARRSTLTLDGKLDQILMEPRFNVYNSVKVTLSNQEFGQISTKEVEVAKYLDFLHTVRVSKDGEDEKAISFD